MALNPTDIDVTNQFLITHMTEKQLKELESSESGLPENAIITTSDIDENISCLRTEVVYDMTSSDASKNWGHTSGIKNNVTVTGKDFSKYEKLIAYCHTNYYNYPIEIDLTIPTQENLYIGRLCIGKGASMLYFAGGETNLEKTSFKARIFRVNQTTNMNTEYDEDSFYVYKIEGVLKTPSMIYTGDELIAGNGIRIENGVISRIPLYKDYFTNAFSSSFKVTTKTSIGNFTFNKVLNNSKLVINYSCPLQDNSNGYGSYIGVNIDGTQIGNICLRNSSGMFCYNEVASNISSGSHNISFFIGCGAGYTTVHAYEHITATVVEVL